MKKILKFMTPSCGQCKVVGKMLKDKGLEVEEIDCTSDENEEIVKMYHVSHVPVVVAIDDDNSIKRLNNIPEVRDWLAHR